MKTRRFLKSIVCIIVLMALSITAFTGCGSTVTSYKMYQAAVEHFENSTELDISITYDMRLIVSGGSSESTIETDIKAISLDENPVFDIKKNVSLFGANVTSEIYYADGIGYVDTLGKKYKAEMDLAQLQKQIDGVVIDIQSMSEFTGLTEEDFHSVTATSDEGTINLKVTLSGNRAKELFSTSLNNAFGIGADALNSVTISDVEMIFSLNQDDYFTRFSMETSIGVHYMNMETQIDLFVEYDINNPGQEVTITPPADLDAYESFDIQ